MAGKLKRKGDVGKVAGHISRNQALRRLQLSLSNFRRLCIYKGVFPRDLKGKPMYYKKDINYLLHDNLINYFRQEKIHKDKIKKAKNINDTKGYELLQKTKPKLDLSLVVKERYPTFDDAIKDLDDALSMVFTFANIPTLKQISHNIIEDCHRFSTEFLHYIIFTKSLRKVFISIKGYYFQASINGSNITWIIPHNLVPIIPNDVDFKILKSFAELYTSFLKFVNCHLYTLSNMVYPPKILGGIIQHRTDHSSHQDLSHRLLSSLCFPLKQNIENLPQIPDLDYFPSFMHVNEESHLMLSNLFKNKVFFLSREIPKQPFVFAIKCCGGLVSWQDINASDVPFTENDTRITHQIIDRPLNASIIIGRIYVQPQWIFDSINSCLNLPCEPYFPGAEIPPHLSPFNSDKHQNLIEQFGKDIAKLDEETTHNSASNQPKLSNISERQKLAALSLPRQKKKLYDKLMRIKKIKIKQHHKLSQKKLLLKPTSSKSTTST